MSQYMEQKVYKFPAPKNGNCDTLVSLARALIESANRTAAPDYSARSSSLDDDGKQVNAKGCMRRNKKHVL